MLVKPFQRNKCDKPEPVRSQLIFYLLEQQAVDSTQPLRQ